MKSIYLLALGALCFGFFGTSCDKEDPEDPNNNNNQNQNQNEDPIPTDMDSYIQALIGSTEDGATVTWNGNQLFRRYYDRATQEYGEEVEMTDDPDVEFKDMSLEMEYDDYTSQRFPESRFGSCTWKDPMGSSGFTWEIRTASPDTMYVNEGLSTEQKWIVLNLNKNTFEFKRNHRSGGDVFWERMIWVR